MNLTEMRAAIRHELQDANSLVWTNDELGRAIKKSVSLMSRFMPKKAIVDTTIVIDVDDEQFTLPAAASGTAIVNAQTLNGVSAGGTLTIADYTPEVPRRLTVTLTDANGSVTDLTILVKGYDRDSHYIEESWHLANLVSGTARQGNLYFRRVIEVEVESIGGTAAAADTVSVGTGNAYDSFIYLNNKAIKYTSEKVATQTGGGGTVYKRNTDYTMDYMNGGIKFINGGAISAGASPYISYDLNPFYLDLSALIPREDYFKIDRVEYPFGNDPPVFLAFEIYGDILLIKGKAVGFTENDHLLISYLKPWSSPGPNSDGDYPEHLDDAVIIGSVGQALIFKAEKYTDLARQGANKSLTTLDVISDVTMPSVPNLKEYYAQAEIALDRARTVLTAVDADMDAIVKVTMPLVPDISSYLTDTDKALDKAYQKLSDAVSALTGMETPLRNANTALGRIFRSIKEAETNLVVGEIRIPRISAAERVAEKYAQYAEEHGLVGQGSGKEAEQDMTLAQGWQSQAEREMAIGNSYINEATQRLALAMRKIELYQTELVQTSQEVAYYESQTKLQSIKGIDVGKGHIEEALQRLSIATTELGKYQVQVAKATQDVGYYQSQIAKAAQYQATSDIMLAIAGRYLASGQAKINEMLVMLGLKAEFNVYKSLSAQVTV